VEPNVEAGVELNAGVDEKFAPNTGASSPNIAGVEPNAVLDEVFAAPCAVPNRILGGPQLRLQQKRPYSLQHEHGKVVLRLGQESECPRCRQ
jgi:hypothetical protein